jgi:uncharacterized protein YjbJ (UPF0337 family)
MAEPRKKYDNKVAEETSAMGERAVGAVKEGVGSVTGNRGLEQRGERQNAEGRARQSTNQVFGTFRDRDSAERAYSSLSSRGYSHNDVNLLMSDDTRKKHFADQNTELGSKAAEGASTGAAIGGATLGILGALAAVGTSVMLPGLGLVLAGPLVTGLAGAGAGGIAGGLIGALVGSGIPEDRAKIYESDIKNGGIVMGVTPRSHEDATYFQNEWQKYNGQNITY